MRDSTFHEYKSHSSGSFSQQTHDKITKGHNNRHMHGHANFTHGQSLNDWDDQDPEEEYFSETSDNENENDEDHASDDDVYDDIHNKHKRNIYRKVFVNRNHKRTVEDDDDKYSDESEKEDDEQEHGDK